MDSTLETFKFKILESKLEISTFTVEFVNHLWVPTQLKFCSGIILLKILGHAVIHEKTRA